MDFLSGVASYICIVNLLKHELANRCGKMPPAIQEEYFLEYSVTGPRIPALAAASRSANRQRRRCLDLLHGKARGDVLERHARNQPLVERVVTLDVGHHHAQHVIDVAGHAIELHHLRHGAHLAGEPVEPLLRVVTGFDRDEDRYAEPEFLLINQRDALLDHALGFQALDALPARRRGEPDEIADLGDGAGGILL